MGDTTNKITKPIITLELNRKMFNDFAENTKKNVTNAGNASFQFSKDIRQAMGNTKDNIGQAMGNTKYVMFTAKDNLLHYSKTAENATYQFSKNHPYVTGVILTSGTVVATPIILTSLGFGATGIVAGSIAAKSMCLLGSGSTIVATAQSIGATGVLISATLPNVIFLSTVSYCAGKSIENLHQLKSKL